MRRAATRQDAINDALERLDDLGFTMEHSFSEHGPMPKARAERQDRRPGDDSAHPVSILLDRHYESALTTLTPSRSLPSSSDISVRTSMSRSG
jgi:hypothetical protein